MRHLAATVLLGWLLMLATGIVNACLVQPGLRDAQAAALEHVAAMAAAHDGPPAVHSHHGGDATGAPTQDPSVPAPCQKLCDEPSTGAQTPKQSFDPSLGIGLLAPPPSAGVPADASGAVTRRAGRDAEAGPPAAPIPILFLRLTL